MGYKNKIYKNYHSLQVRHIEKSGRSASGREQFPVYVGYYQKYLPKDKNTKVIDIACGDGSLVRWLQGLGYDNASGIDVSQEQADLAKAYGANNIEQEDCFSFLAKKKNEFDTIFALDILEHLSKGKTLELLQLIFESLKPEGVFILKTLNGESIFSGRYAYSDLTHETIFTKRSLQEAFALVGFAGAEFREAGPLAHGLVSFARVVLWQITRILLNAYLLIETGQKAEVLTQNIIAVAKK